MEFKNFEVLEKIASQQAKQGKDVSNLKELIQKREQPVDEAEVEAAINFPVASMEDFCEIEKKNGR